MINALRHLRLGHLYCLLYYLILLLRDQRLTASKVRTHTGNPAAAAPGDVINALRHLRLGHVTLKRLAF